MKTCGGNRWWIKQAALFIRRESGTKELLIGIACLLVSAGLGLYAVDTREWNARVLIWAWILLCLGLHSALSVSEATLDTGSGQVSWAWGLGVPFFRRTRPLTAFDRVQVTTPAHDLSAKAMHCVVQLVGEGGAPEVLSRSTVRDEALTLAEAVARHARLGLQVDGGRVRSDEARGAGLEDGSASVEPSLPPPGCRVQVREEEGRLEVLLPAPGWKGGFLSRGLLGFALMGFALALCGLIVVRARVSWSLLARMTPFMLVPFGFGVAHLRRALVGVRTTWHVTVTLSGLEVVRAGSGAPQTTRVSALVIRDVDVREFSEGAPGVSPLATCPMLVIDRQDGEKLVLGVGLPRGELEWAAARLREALAGRAEVRRAQAHVG
jgi:hypothetical protein